MSHRLLPLLVSATVLALALFLIVSQSPSTPVQADVAGVTASTPSFSPKCVLTMHVSGPINHDCAPLSRVFLLEPSPSGYRSFHTSAAALYSAFERLDNSDADPFLSDLAERDTANSVTLLNTLLGDSSHDRVGDGELTNTKLSESLSR